MLKAWRSRENDTDQGIRLWRRTFVATSGLAALTVMTCLLAAVRLGPARVGAARPLGDEGFWTTYTAEDSLPSNTVYGGVAIDAAGAVWAGFENGDWNNPLPANELVSRFDGDSWTNFVLYGCRVTPLVASDEVYAGTYCPGPPSGSGGGLSAFIGGTWVTFTPTDGLAGDYVRAIAPEGDNRVWISSGYTIFDKPYLSLLDHKGTPDKEDDEWTQYDLEVQDISAIALDPQGNRWFGSGWEGVWVLPGDGGEWLHYPPDVISGANDIAFDAEGNVWFGRNEEVSRFDGTSWTHYETREEAIEQNFAAVMTSLNRDGVDTYGFAGLWAVEPPAGVWIGRVGYLNERLGVGFYDGQQWTTYTVDNSPIGSNRVYGIAVDGQHNVWVGTGAFYGDGEGGLNKFTPAPAFSLQVSPGAFFLEPGQARSLSLDVALLRGWAPTATLSLEGLPAGATAWFSQNPVTPTAEVELVISTSQSTPPGSYPLTVSAKGTGVTHTAAVTLHVVEEVYYGFLTAVRTAAFP
jgi:hypothetical protein